MVVEKYIDKLQVRKHFSCHAKEYDRYAVVQQKVANRLASGLRELNRSWCQGLEVGCGTGMLSRQLLRNQEDIQLVLSDIAHGMSQYVQSTIPNSPVCDADAASLPFLSESFDLVATSSVYQWLNDLPNAFQEVARILKPGGVFGLAMFGEKTLYELRDSHKAVLPPDRVSHVQNFPSLNEIRSIADSKFEVISLKSEFETEWHDDVQGLLRSLKKIGAQNASQKKPLGLSSRKIMQQMISHYNNHYGTPEGTPATYEVIYLLAQVH